MPRTAEAVRIPQKARSILRKKSFGHLATLMDDGEPHVTPVWVDEEDGQILVNTAEGRLKPENVREDDRVAISVTDPDDPYTAVVARGRAELDHEGAEEHIDSLAQKYIGAERYPWRQPGEERVIVRITPETLSVKEG